MKDNDAGGFIFSEAKTEEDFQMAALLILMSSRYKSEELRHSLFCEIYVSFASGSRAFLAKHGGHVVGAAITTPDTSDGNRMPVVRVRRIAVHPRARKKGVARLIVERICEIFGRIDAVTETKESAIFFRKVLPYSKRIKAKLNIFEKNEGFDKRNMICFSNKPIDFNEGIHAAAMPDFEFASRSRVAMNEFEKSISNDNGIKEYFCIK